MDDSVFEQFERKELYWSWRKGFDLIQLKGNFESEHFLLSFYLFRTLLIKYLFFLLCNSYVLGFSQEIDVKSACENLFDVDSLRTGLWCEDKIIENYNETAATVQVMYVGTYFKGIKVGVWKTYHKDKNILLSEYEMAKDGNTSKFRRTYHTNGRLKHVSIGDASLFNYYSSSYDQKGMLSDTCYTQDQIMTCKSYYENGKLRRLGVMDSNRNYRKSEEYSSYGMLLNSQEFVNNRRHGILNRYYENGLIRFEYSYKNGKRDGVCKQYYDSGFLKELITYVDDEKKD